MDEKTVLTLEYGKVLERLVGYASFSASAELGRALRPTQQPEEALNRQALTREARRLLSVNDMVGVGGAHDVRPLAELARRGGVLNAGELLDIKNTLIAARELWRAIEKVGEEYPHILQLAQALPPPGGVVDVISRTVSERGEVLDGASSQLASIRSELKVAHERLLSRLERMINDPKTAPMLQEAIITQRNGRYVIPLRADFKGRVRSIVHDQSASGATLFVEPLVVVDLNNRWHELQLAERDEVRRILAEVSAQVGQHGEAIAACVLALAQIDLALMCAKYADDLHASEPELVLFKKPAPEDHPGSTIRLYQARHPLLDPETVVPIDVVLDERTFALVITGPNTGGKTVTLKTVGLLVLMAQSGLHIPAQSGSALTIFRNVYADIGDEQSIEQSLSTFSGHITNIVRILMRANAHTLVLLDELGAGTDPQEGASLARAILAHLLERRITCLVATHYPELKAYAHATPGVVNASMEFNLQTLRPSYHLTIGLPGRSNALAIAERLGLPKAIIQAARATLDPNDLRAEDLLDEIHHQRDLARQARSAADRARNEAERTRNELSRRLEKVEDERRAILEKAQNDARAELADVQRQLDELRRSLARARQPVEALKSMQEQVETLQEEVQTPVERQQHIAAAAPRKLRLGERVRLRSLNMEGVVRSIGESEIEVQLGALRVRARLDDVQRGGEPLEEASPEPPATRPAASRPHSEAQPARQNGAVFRESPGMELDLRGQRAEDAVDAMERYLENAYLTGLPFVRIIHGRGTGRLRQVIREALRQSPHVANFASGEENEGGDGVTVARLAVD